jgi:hypothetical protein
MEREGTINIRKKLRTYLIEPDTSSRIPLDHDMSNKIFYDYLMRALVHMYANDKYGMRWFQDELKSSNIQPVHFVLRHAKSLCLRLYGYLPMWVFMVVIELLPS